MRSIKDKVTVACSIAGMTVTELGEKTGYSQSAFSQKLKRGKFTQEELQQMAHILGCEYHSSFTFDREGITIE